MWIRNRAASLAGGSDVRVRPLPADKAQETSRDVTTIQHVQARGNTLRVLICDDDRDTTHTLSRLVERWGHDVQGAYNGVEALQLAFAYQPDVLLLDIAMPGMNGYDLARRLRDETRFAHALLIAISGYADEHHRRLAQASGFDQFLVKPAMPSIVEELLLLERDRLTRLLKKPLMPSRKDSICPT